MARVCVIGSGQAGVSAAVESAVSGARVTLLERTSRLRGRGLFEEDDSRPSPCGPLERLRSFGVEVLLEEQALSVGAQGAVRTSGGRASYDSVVLATGSRGTYKPFPGIRKPGVLILDRPDALDEEEDRLSSARSVVVSGSGLRALRVADRVTREGRRVSLLTGEGWAEDFLSPDASSLLLRAAVEAGVSFVKACVDRALGLGAVEAVSAGGLVLPCDLLVVVPSTVPSVPPVEAELHHGGAVLVDRFLRSSSPGVFAAGGCAYLPPYGVLGGGVSTSTPRSSGRAAGANASGHRVTFSPVRALEVEVFGLRLDSVGLSQREARRGGLDAGMIQRSSSERTCSVVFDRRDSGVLGAQLVGKPGAHVLDYLSQAVSQRVSLFSIAYQELSDSTDISLVSEAAREELRRGKG